MIDYQCPHCKRMLRISEKFIGLEGACHYCGARIVVEASMPEGESPPEVEEQPEVFQDALDLVRTQLANSRRDNERLAREVETLKAERLEREAQLNEALARVRDLEEAPDRAQQAEQPEVLPDEPLVERAPEDDSEPIAPAPQREIVPVAPAIRRTDHKRLVLALVLFGVALVLLTGSLWMPPMNPKRAGSLEGKTGTDSLFGSLKSVSVPAFPGTPKSDVVPVFPEKKDEPPAPVTGGIEAVATYYLARAQTGTNEVPAAKAALIVVRQASDNAYDPPEQWKECESDGTGKAVLDGLTPGRYLVRERFDGARDTWKPLDPATVDAQDLVTVQPGQTAHCTVRIVDNASAVQGSVVDAKTAKPIPGATLSVSGEATGHDSLLVTSSEDGSFRIDPREMGYGPFTIRCTAPPKGYSAAKAESSGTRQPGAATGPVRIALSKRAKAK